MYFLGGLTCTHENFAQKSNFGYFAKKHRICMVFPDTSPRDTGIEGIKEDWECGEGAGYYLDATVDKYKGHFNMYSYITKELPEVIQ